MESIVLMQCYNVSNQTFLLMAWLFNRAANTVWARIYCACVVWHQHLNCHQHLISCTDWVVEQLSCLYSAFLTFLFPHCFPWLYTDSLQPPSYCVTVQTACRCEGLILCLYLLISPQFPRRFTTSPPTSLLMRAATCRSSARPVGNPSHPFPGDT